MTKRLHRILIYPLAASVPAVGMLIATGTAAGASTAQSPAASSSSPSAQATALAREAIRHLSIGQHATNENAGNARTINGETDTQSNNWSGWADKGSAVSKVSASW